MTIGFDRHYAADAEAVVVETMLGVIETLARRGHMVVPVDLPRPDDFLGVHAHIAGAEALAFHKDAIARNEAFPEAAQQLFAIAKGMSTSDHVHFNGRRVALRKQVDLALHDVDLILTPTLPIARPPLEGTTRIFAGNDHDYMFALVRYTCLFNTTGHPVVNLPANRSSETAVGGCNS